jgi:Mrp family chromosome partitioning ATPase
MINNAIHLQEDVERLTPITIIGNVLHSRLKTELVVMEDPRAPITESYRTIRTNLQYMLDKTKSQIIGIHSIRPGEGKTFTSTNLACILAMNDKKVLMIGPTCASPVCTKYSATSIT